MFSDLVTGDKRTSAFSDLNILYNSGPKLVVIFNELQFNDEYGEGFPTRWYYAQERLQYMNNQDRIQDFIKHYLRPQNLIDWDKESINGIFETINKYLKYDEYKIYLTDKDIKIEKTDGSIVEAPQIEGINNDYIIENVRKCEKRIQEGDLSGAVTIARSLLESVLKHLYKEIFTQEAHNLDLPELYKQVSKELNLHPTSSKLDEGLKKIAGGLHTAVVGLSEVRNEAGDAHPLKYNIEEHHAVLVVNNAKTICQFLYQSYKKQNPTPPSTS